MTLILVAFCSKKNTLLLLSLAQVLGKWISIPSARQVRLVILNSCGWWWALSFVNQVFVKSAIPTLPDTWFSTTGFTKKKKFMVLPHKWTVDNKMASSKQHWNVFHKENKRFNLELFVDILPMFSLWEWHVYPVENSPELAIL